MKEVVGEVRVVYDIGNPIYRIKVGKSFVEATLKPNCKLPRIRLGYIVRVQTMKSDSTHGIITSVVKKV